MHRRIRAAFAAMISAMLMAIALAGPTEANTPADERRRPVVSKVRHPGQWRSPEVVPG